MHDISLKNVAINISGHRKTLYEAIARLLKEKYQTKVHLYVATEDEVRGFEKINNEKLWDTISSTNFYTTSADILNLEVNKVIDDAINYEQLLGETYNRLMLGHRQLGRGYSPGTVHYPRIRMFENMDYVHVINAINETLSFWKNEIKSKEIDLILDGGKEVACLARALDIPYRRIIGSRYKNYWFWTQDEYQSNPLIEKHFENVNEFDVKDIEKGYGVATIRHDTFKSRISCSSCLKRTLDLIPGALWRYIKKYDSSRSLNFSEQIKLPFLERKMYLKAKKYCKYKIEELDSEFVYFPLHKEPEISYLLRSPEFTNQQAAIMALSRDLPAGVTLAVKENMLSSGQRSEYFYQQLNDLKNIKLIDMHEDSLELIRKCEFVATITGTAGIEGAILGKPVLTFSKHAVYDFLDHVKIIGGGDDLRSEISWALSKNNNREKAIEDGARFLEALKLSSFDMKEYATKKGKSRFLLINDEIVDIAYKGLTESLGNIKS